MVGTDYGFMETIFPRRDRMELKRKYHFEELNNPDRVEESNSARIPINPELLKEEGNTSFVRHIEQA